MATPAENIKLNELWDQFNKFLSDVEAAGFQYEFTTCCCGEGLKVLLPGGKEEVFYR